MKPIEPWKTWLFIGSLMTIAFIINSWRSEPRRELPRFPDVSSGDAHASRSSVTSQEVKKSPSKVIEKTPREIAQERARYIARYLVSSPSRKSGIDTVGVVVSSENRTLNAPLATGLSDHFSSERARALPSLFTPEFVTDGLFAEAWNNGPEVLSRLGLTNSLDALLLARQKVDYSNNPSLENVITAKMSLEILLVPATVRSQNRAWSFRSNGAGFTTADARALAEERLIKEFVNDQSLPLAQIPKNTQ